MYRSVAILLLSAITFIAKSQALQPQTVYSSDFTIDEKPRHFNFYVPLHYAKHASHPLMIFLSNNSTAKASIKTYGDMLHAHADSTGTVIVYPDPLTNWRTGNAKDSINDAGFLSILIDYFVQRYQCRSSIFICGLGTGGALAYNVQCLYPSKITAVASFFNSENNNLCTDTGVGFMDTKAYTANSKLDAAAISSMFRFFMKYVKE